MAHAERHYNEEYLQHRAGLDTERGIKLSGSKWTYFFAIGKFHDEGQEVVRALRKESSPTKQRGHLGQLSVLLRKIFATDLSGEIEEVLALMRRDVASQEAHARLPALCDAVLALWREVDCAQEGAGKHEKAPGDGQEASNRVFLSILGAFDAFDLVEVNRLLRSLAGHNHDPQDEIVLEKIKRAMERGDVDAAYQNAKQLAGRVQVAEQAGDRKKILAVDDMPDILNTIKRMLEDQYTPYCVTNHIDALKLIDLNPPDLILLDIEMPRMDGFKFLRMLRLIESCRNTPVIFLTEKASAENIKLAIELGGNDFIRKPVEQKTLLDKIRKNMR